MSFDILDRAGFGQITDQIAGRTQVRQPEVDYVSFEIKKQEQTASGGLVEGEVLSLSGNQLPFQPFIFGGDLRASKHYYPGNDEAVAQVMGSSESDITIRGHLRADYIRNEKYRAYPYYVANRIDLFRREGHLCQFVLGSWSRYGYIKSTNFSLVLKSKIEYEITFMIISVNAPRNARLFTNVKEVPKNDSEDLKNANITLADLGRRSIVFTPTIAERIDGLVSDVADAIGDVTYYVDVVF